MPMPSFSAARGESTTASRPSTRIWPLSAGCAPARIFISVDFPAPFSPTSTSTSPASQRQRHVGERAHARERLPDARASRADAPCPFDSGSVRLGRVGFRERTDFDFDDGRRRACRRSTRGSRRSSCCRSCCGYCMASPYICAVCDGRARFGRRVVSDDGDLTGEAGRLDGRDRTERRVVVDAEDAA